MWTPWKQKRKGNIMEGLNCTINKEGEERVGG